MATSSKSAQQLMALINGSIIGDPAEARSFCERMMNPNFLRLKAGGDRTDFERTVENVTFLRTNCKKWDASLKFFAQEGNKISARIVCDMAIGDDPVKTSELMLMAELDDQGRLEKAWEQIAEYVGSGEE